MGANGSCPVPRYGWCIRAQNPNICKENHTTPSGKGHRRNLSAAFHLADVGKVSQVDQLDINRATEEELMTLPGINRQTAHNVVEYRRQIGGFKKVEDIALVSGVGATKLNMIRLEICVGKRPKSSLNSSPNSSKVDLQSMQDDVSRASAKSQSGRSAQPAYGKTNVNTSNVFQLMKVNGVTQLLAENIVAHRDRKGPFKSLDDLVKVKGIKAGVLSALRPYLVLRDEAHQNGHAPGSSPNGPTTPLRQQGDDTLLSEGSPAGGGQGHSPSGSEQRDKRRSASVLGSQEDLISMYGPLASRSFRNRKKPVLFRKNNRHVLRVATWNLQACDVGKAENPGVKEVVAMTTLENGFSILAVQELLEPESFDKLCGELNAPTVPNVKKWSDHQGSWKCVTSAPVGKLQQRNGQRDLCVGFLYDVSRGIECKSITVADWCHSTDKGLSAWPCIAVFKVKDWEVAVANIQLVPGETTESSLLDVIGAVEENAQGCRDVVVVGDFGMSPDVKEFNSVRGRGYKNGLVADKYTNISVHNPEGSRNSSNLWMSDHMQTLHTGQCDVVREGMTNPWIPDGWGWGGTVSDHCPVWAEFYIDSTASPPSSTAPGDAKETSSMLPLDRGDHAGIVAKATGMNGVMASGDSLPCAPQG